MRHERNRQELLRRWSWRGAVGAIAAVLVLCGTPAGAKDLTRLSNGEVSALSERLIGQVGQGHADKACEAGEAAAEDARRRSQQELLGIVASMEGICAVLQGRARDALQAFGRFESLAQDYPRLRGISPSSDTLSLHAAIQVDAWDDFVTHATHIALRDQPEELAELSPDVIRYAFRTMPEALAGRLAVTFGSMDNFAALPSELQPLLARQAILPALSAQDTAFAQKMAGQVTWPASVIKMLVDRRYEPLWPALATRVGPRLRVLLDGRADRAAALAAAHPGDTAKAADAMLAALDAGRYAEVERMALALGLGRSRVAKLDEQGAWATQYYAFALDQLGRPAEADALFDALAALPTDKRNWVVNFAINRTERLVQARRWKDAAAAADRAMAVAAAQGSPYARQAAAAGRLCAQHQLGQAVEPGERAHALDNAKSNLGSTVGLALCLGEPGAATSALLHALADPEQRGDALLMLQPPQLVPLVDASFGGPLPVSLLADHPELKAAFEAAGRTLPEPLLLTPRDP